MSTETGQGSRVEVSLAAQHDCALLARGLRAQADRLHALADGIDSYASAFPATSRPVSLAAEIVQTYAQAAATSTGGLHVALASLVRTANVLDQVIREEGRAGT